MWASYVILCFRCIGVSFVFDLCLVLKHHSEEHNANFILASLPSVLLENKSILFRIMFFSLRMEFLILTTFYLLIVGVEGYCCT